MEPDDPRNISTDSFSVGNADGSLGIYPRGDSLRIVNYDDGTSLDFPKSLARVLAMALIAQAAEPMPPHEPTPRVVHQPRRVTRSLSEGFPKGG